MQSFCYGGRRHMLDIAHNRFGGDRMQFVIPEVGEERFQIALLVMQG